jgi:hypothetical protein
MNDTNPTAFPLQWPRNKKRTPELKRARFGVFKTARDRAGDDLYRPPHQRITIAGALARLRDEMRRLDARNVVISSNLALRQDGTPRSDRRAPDDPGVAVYCRVEGDPVALACDKFADVAQNIAAIAAHISASRAIERHGVGSLREIFRGFLALPGAVAPDDWREILGEPTTLREAEARYYDAMRTAHPDIGGSEAEAAKLNAAIAQARSVLR